MPSGSADPEPEAIDPDPPATLQSALELGTEWHGLMRQRDTYFDAVNDRLKLREAPPNPDELIARNGAEMAA